jgi:predicted membrane protein
MDEDRSQQRRQERLEGRRERFERRWERKRHRSSAGRHLFGGVLLLTLGVVFLLGNMGVLDAERIIRFWPVILIAGGVVKILEYGDAYGQSSGIFWIVIGILFLLMSLNVFRMGFQELWPVILIGLGALMLWKSALGGRRGASDVDDLSGKEGAFRREAGTDDVRRSTPVSSNSVISAAAILGRVERRNNSQDFRGGNATALMGGCEIDLRAAAISPSREPVLEVFAMWGGIEIRVPSDWTVVSYVDPILGGYEDHTQPPKEESHRLRIRGTVLMGGVEVTN